MAKATLIKGNTKVVVETGSQEAQNYFGQGYTLLGAAAPKAAAPAAAPGAAPAPVNTNVSAPAAPAGKPAATQASSLGNTTLANKNYVQATFKEIHGRDATAAELAQFTGKGVQDVYNAINAGAPVAKATLDSAINAAQDENIANKDAEINGKPERSQAMKEAEALMTPNTEKPTAPPKLEETFNTLKTEYGLLDLENTLNDLKNEERVLIEQTNERKDYAESKQVALGVISGKQTEVDRQANKQLESLRRQQTYISDQLKTKYGIIENLMNFRQKDFENASSAYEKEFNQNIQLMNLVRSDEKEEKDEAETKKDNARADYTILINGIKDSGGDLTNIDPANKAMLNKLEAQSGLPVGTFELILPKLADQKLQSLGTGNNSSGGQSAWFMTIDKNTGKPNIISVPLPGSVATKTGGGGTSQAEKDEAERKKEVKAFQTKAAELVGQLDTGNTTWGAAYDSLKIMYPQFEGLIDETLGGGYDKDKGEYYGRAAQ